MHKTIDEAVQFCQDFLPLVADVSKVDMAICPPFISLDRVSQLLVGEKVSLGAQNVFYEENGAYTGEISPLMLKDVNCNYALVGHSERRHIIGERDEAINKKVKAVLAHDIIPILCVGETLAEREDHKAKEVVKKQLEKAMNEIVLDNNALVIAYEPVWAIGTGINASADDAEEMSFFIREHLAKLYSNSIAEKTIILYGGSVKTDNIGDFLSRDNVDGALVGGASLDASSFANLIRIGENV